MEEFKIICGRLEGTGQAFPQKVKAQLERMGNRAVLQECRSKLEIEYAVFQEKGMANVLLEENSFAGVPYLAWEIASLKDIGQAHIVVLLDRRHFGTAYLDILYSAGILDAVFEDEGDAAMAAGLFLRGRNRKESRGYYGLRSLHETSSVLQVMEQERIERYIRYIGAGASEEDVLARYREIATQLKNIEICCLVGNLPESLREELQKGGGVSPCSSPKTRRNKHWKIQKEDKMEAGLLSFRMSWQSWEHT